MHNCLPITNIKVLRLWDYQQILQQTTSSIIFILFTFSSFSNAKQLRSLWLQIGVQESARPCAFDVFISIEPNLKEEMGRGYQSQGQKFDAHRVKQGLWSTF